MTVHVVLKKADHKCHALGCTVAVPPRLLMCKKHWGMVTSAVRRAICKHYRVGQCEDKKPSAEWVRYAKMAIDEVANKENFAEYPKRISGTKLVCEVPDGYTSCAFVGEDVIAVGPEVPPIRWSAKSKQWIELAVDGVPAEAS